MLPNNSYFYFMYLNYIPLKNSHKIFYCLFIIRMMKYVHKEINGQGDYRRKNIDSYNNTNN